MKTIQTYCCNEHLKEQTELGKSLNKPVREIQIFDAEKGKIVCTFCLMADIITFADCKIETEID